MSVRIDIVVGSVLNLYVHKFVCYEDEDEKGKRGELEGGVFYMFWT